MSDLGSSSQTPYPAQQPAEQEWGSQAPAHTGKSSGPRAGFWRRFAAALIDGILLGVIQVILVQLLDTAGVAVYFVIAIGYYIALEGGPTGQTLGKRALGIRVLDFKAGGSIGYGRAALRYVARILSTIPLFLGYLWMLWDGEKQTWHDKIANSVVVPVDAYPVQR